MKYVIKYWYMWFLRIAGATFTLWFLGMYVLGTYFPEQTVMTPTDAYMYVKPMLYAYLVGAVFLAEKICKYTLLMEAHHEDKGDATFLARCVECAWGYFPIAGHFLRKRIIEKIPQLATSLQ